MAVQLIATAGANAIGVISEDDKRDFVMQLGAKGVINRKDFDCWGQLPDVDDQDDYAEWHEGGAQVRRGDLGHHRQGQRRRLRVRASRRADLPGVVLVVKRGGMVVICAGTTGYNLTMDARYLWMRQKRIQGSHFANLLQAGQANKLVIERRIDPCMSEVFAWGDIPRAHIKMWRTSTSPATWRCWSRPSGRACARSRTRWKTDAAVPSARPSHSA